MIKFNKISPIIYTTDIENTINFYVNLIGFNCTDFDKEIGWARVQVDNIELMISLPNAQLEFQKPFFTGSFYFNLDDVDALWQYVKEKVTVCYPIENFDYGMREFGIFDNNGYLLQFGQEVVN